MSNHGNLENLAKDQLIELIDVYSRNWLAMDGVWFRKDKADHTIFGKM